MGRKRLLSLQSTMRHGSRRLFLIIAGLLLVLALGGWLFHDSGSSHRSSVLSRINAVWYDWRFQLLPPERDPFVPIVIIDIDEFTQQREGRWPWDRHKLADLVTSLQHHGTVLIGFDVVFAEPGTNVVEHLLGRVDFPEAVVDVLRPLEEAFDGDAAFARTLTDQSVLGYFLHADGSSMGQLPPPFLELTDETGRNTSLLSMPDYTASLPMLAQHALASGFVVAIPDIDGVVRRVPLVMRHENGVYASLSLEMARLALGAPWIRLQEVIHDDRRLITGVQVGRLLNIPLDGQGYMLVPFRGQAGSFPTLSATRVLRGDLSDEQRQQLDGALVLIGTSALGLADLRTIPLQTAYPGVEVHANALEAMLHAALQNVRSEDTGLASPFYYHPDWEIGATLAFLIVLGLFLAVFLPGRSPYVMLLTTCLALLGVVGLNLALWEVWHLALPVAVPVAAILLIAGLNIAAGYVMAMRQKRNVERLFGEYVPPDYVARMLAHPEQISLEGEQRDMTVLFADVRGFTAVSESLSPAKLKLMLNRYLSAITEVIFAHHGTIDKYVGDLVMAFWNAPLDDPDHAKHAVQAALAMQARMRTLRKEFLAEGLPTFHIGIGIHTGTMNVGDMGSTYRRAYTVLGDSVNLASRLESLTGFYHVPVLISDATRQRVPSFTYRSIDIVRVKGRRQELIISQPLDADQDARVLTTLEDHEAAFIDYREGRVEQAYQRFQMLAQRYETSLLYSWYLERLDVLRKQGAELDPAMTITVHEAK